MANFTKQAIKLTFFQLIDKYPLAKISVKDITDACGINRNSFYYHYQDLPALIEEIMKETFEALLEKYPDITSLDDLFKDIAFYAISNKRAILHIFNSVKRDAFEGYLSNLCEYAVERYIDTAFDKVKETTGQLISENDEKIIIKFVKCELMGMSLEWLNMGMPEEAIADLSRMMTLFHGVTDDMILRIASNVSE